MPVVTHHMYQASCRAIGRNAGCGECKLCKFHLVLDAVSQAAEWTDAPQWVGDIGGWRWKTVTAALEDYASYQMVGFGSRSIGETLLLLARIGVMAPSTATRETPAEQAAEECVAIEQALEQAFDEHNNRGLSTRTCIALLIAAKVGNEEVRTDARGRMYRHVHKLRYLELAGVMGMSAMAAKGLVQSGERRVAIDLCARGLVRPPRTPDIGREIEARRCELAARRTGGKGKAEA